MKKHAAIMKPKFDAMYKVLNEELDGLESQNGRSQRRILCFLRYTPMRGRSLRWLRSMA
ncbi:MAG: hypothetical protein ACLSG5_13365 [Oscillospiraceae bacterium]